MFDSGLTLPGDSHELRAPPYPGVLPRDLWHEPLGLGITLVASKWKVMRKALSEIVMGRNRSCRTAGSAGFQGLHRGLYQWRFAR